MKTRTGTRLQVALLTATLALFASATAAAPVSWDISVFGLTGVLAGNTYSGMVTVDDSYLVSGAQLLTPSNSDLTIVFDFVDGDGVTPRRFTESDDVDYPLFPSFSLLDGEPVAHPTTPPEPPKGPLSFVYFDETSLQSPLQGTDIPGVGAIHGFLGRWLDNDFCKASVLGVFRLATSSAQPAQK